MENNNKKVPLFFDKSQVYLIWKSLDIFSVYCKEKDVSLSNDLKRLSGYFSKCYELFDEMTVSD